VKIFKPIIILSSLFFISFGCSDSDGISPTIELLGKLSLSGGLTDVWGYFDNNTGKEYALVGYGLFSSGVGVFIVDVSDPTNPVLVAEVDSVPGFDLKVWDKYLYTVNGGGSGRGGIVDISDPENPQVVGSFPSAHNIFIAQNGVMYLEAPGLRIFDLNQDPTNPTLVWSGGSAGHDAAVIGNRLYDFHGAAATNIYDVNDPANPKLLGSIDSSIRFHHSGWPTEDRRFLFICDEGAVNPTSDITVWDISQINNPKRINEFTDNSAKVHNLYILGDFAYVSYYTAGFRVFDIADPTRINLVDEFDTTMESGEAFRGAFGVYPFTPSGNIYVSDITTGLFIFSFGNGTTNTNNILAHLDIHQNKLRSNGSIVLSKALFNKRHLFPDLVFRSFNSNLN
jgi:choice-of-anchor B domain-containing protein